MTYSGIINPLDLQSILVGHLAGSIEVFTILALIFIAVLSAKYRMNAGIFATMVLLFIGIMGLAVTGAIGFVVVAVTVIIFAVLIITKWGFK